MTFPAWFELYRDVVIVRHASALPVYAEILSRPTAFHSPQEVKAWALAELLGVKKETVLGALNLLVERGYLLEHDRGQNNVRRFTVAITRASGSPPQRTQPLG